MLFSLFGIAVLLAIVVGLVKGVPAWQLKKFDRAFSWIVGLPLLVVFLCFLIGVVIFANTDMNF
ncbi:MAG TPA: hypothetical protein PK428_03910 [Phycicoccus sp.]|jgi:hypothetical protein|nr:hypothetical protein [Phycicoccus sp.]